jgi:hypothetical protein
MFAWNRARVARHLELQVKAAVFEARARLKK